MCGDSIEKWNFVKKEEFWHQYRATFSKLEKGDLYFFIKWRIIKHKWTTNSNNRDTSNISYISKLDSKSIWRCSCGKSIIEDNNMSFRMYFFGYLNIYTSHGILDTFWFFTPSLDFFLWNDSHTKCGNFFWFYVCDFQVEPFLEYISKLNFSIYCWWGN